MDKMEQSPVENLVLPLILTAEQVKTSPDVSTLYTNCTPRCDTIEDQAKCTSIKLKSILVKENKAASGRRDRFGNLIRRDSKTHHISFNPAIDEKKKIAATHPRDEEEDDHPVKIKTKAGCSCVII